MLLTVYQQGNLAEQRWRSVQKPDQLNERDRILYNNSDGLVWAYKSLPNDDRVLGLERQEVEGYMDKMQNSANLAGNYSPRVYIGTIKILLAIKLADSEEVHTPELANAVSEKMVMRLEDYVNLFNESDQSWVRNNWNTTTVDDGTDILEFRNRIWLRDNIKTYMELAEANCLNPVWKPQWINEFKQPLKEEDCRDN